MKESVSLHILSRCLVTPSKSSSADFSNPARCNCEGHTFFLLIPRCGLCCVPLVEQILDAFQMYLHQWVFPETASVDKRGTMKCCQQTVQLNSYAICTNNKTLTLPAAPSEFLRQAITLSLLSQGSDVIVIHSGSIAKAKEQRIETPKHELVIPGIQAQKSCEVYHGTACFNCVSHSHLKSSLP